MFPPEFRKNPVHFQGLGLAFVYVTLAILQLFTFESFVEVTLGFGFPGGRVVAIIIALLLPIAEILALPYLISMKVPLWTNISGNNGDNLGIFGATLYTANQWWSVGFVALVSWAAWLIYVAQPSRRVHHTTAK